MHESLQQAGAAYSPGDVLIAKELMRRSCRSPEYAAENRALLTLAQELTNSLGGVLQKVAKLAMELCRAESAGISILEPGGKNGVFRWHAVAGELAANLGETMPFEASPSGLRFPRNCVLLFDGAECFFPTLHGGEPRIYENLVAPWEINGHVAGTLWVVAHEPLHRFDAEDARLLRSLTHFAAAVWSLIKRTRAAEELRGEHRAALNLMEDAIEARETAEQASAELRKSEARQALLVRLGDALRPLPDPIDIQAEACRLLGEHLQVSRVTFAEIEGDEFIIRPGYVSGVEPLTVRSPIAAFGRVALEAYRRGEPIAVTDVHGDPRFTDAERSAFIASGITAFTGVILIKGGCWVGAFSTHNATPREWTNFELQLIREVADRVWSSIERARAEEALRRSEERLKKAISIETVGVLFFNLDGAITDANEAFLRMSGYRRADIEQGHARWMELTAPEFIPATMKSKEEFLTKGQNTPYEKQYIRPDGTRWWGLFAGRKLSENECVEFVVDITERKRAEEALEQHRRELWEALQETERARREAEEAGRAKDHFLAVLSHELRTPLNPVIIATRMLARRKDLPPGMAEMVEMIERNIKLEAQFIDELLDLTRMARGKIELNREPMDLHTPIWHAVQVADPDIQAKNQQLNITLDAQEHQVLGDATRLQQVFWNLLKNASKFTPEGGEIVLRSWSELGWIVVEVQDTGIGFEPEAAGRIFAAFEQASEAVTREYGGLGLGLAISKAAVEAHEGELRAWSGGQNQGATFSVILPLSSAPGNAVAGQP